ncbi:hypothetical protein KIN20_018145 [Parelaphostrongylus tenuis]|uniref:Uncharacterized protein n=1 Tax=Parelaphostrongylus tenuis TaxID=148309 RepID=A0AAD5MJH6_PARTN|nr:hypothetical protein KIN20_018145 [Parelaphostrongylus tenuis]
MWSSRSVQQVTQMVHDLREQVVPQRPENLRLARAAPSCHQPQQAVRSTGIIRTVVRHPRTTSPQFIVDSLLLSLHSLVIM